MVVSVVRIFFDKTETTDTTIWKPGFKRYYTSLNNNTDNNNNNNNNNNKSAEGGTNPLADIGTLRVQFEGGPNPL